MTKQRKKILAVLQENGGHMTAGEIHASAVRDIPGLSLGTVYRNLSLLVSEGRIGQLSFSGKPDRYERRATPHDHLTCDICGSVKDVLIPGLADAISYQTGERVLSYSLVIRYRCSACRDRLARKEKAPLEETKF